MDAARPTMPVATFLVERYWPGVTVEAFTEAAGRLRDSVGRLRDEGYVIRTIASTLVPPDEAAYWVVDATSADVIAMAWARAGVPAERIVAALELRESHGREVEL